MKPIQILLLFLSPFLVNTIIANNLNKLQSIDCTKNSHCHQIIFNFNEAIIYEKNFNTLTNTLELTLKNIEKIHTKSVEKQLILLKNNNILTKITVTNHIDTSTIHLFFNTISNNKTLNDLALLIGIKTLNKKLIINIYNIANLTDSNFIASEENATILKKNNPSDWRIAIDPGHGGKDPGAIGKNNIMEKTLAFQIAKFLERKLKEKGFLVKLTRSDDTFISLAERPSIAADFKADILISIHLNATQEFFSYSSGIETYSLKKPILNTNNCIHDYIFINHDYNEKIINYSEKLYLNVLKKSKNLASSIQKNLISTLKKNKYTPNDRGKKTDTFRIFLHNSIPTALVETGFISNNDEIKLLQKPTYQKALSEGIYQGIIKYILKQNPNCKIK